MPGSRLPMRKIRDVLRLSAAGLSKRQIAANLGIGPTAAGACLRRAREAGVGWPLPDDLDDAALERRLYPIPTTPAKDWRSLPDWPAIHRELRRKGVTLQLVWEEYRAAHPNGYGAPKSSPVSSNSKTSKSQTKAKRKASGKLASGRNR